MIKNIAIILLIFLGFSTSFAGDMNYLRADSRYHLSMKNDQTFTLTGANRTITSVYELSDSSSCPIKLYSASGDSCCISMRNVGPKVVIDAKTPGYLLTLGSDFRALCEGGVYDKVE